VLNIRGQTDRFVNARRAWHANTTSHLGCGHARTRSAGWCRLDISHSAAKGNGLPRTCQSQRPGLPQIGKWPMQDPPNTSVHRHHCVILKRCNKDSQQQTTPVIEGIQRFLSSDEAAPCSTLFFPLPHCLLIARLTPPRTELPDAKLRI